MVQLSVEDERYLHKELPSFGILSVWFGGFFVTVTAVTQILHQTIEPTWARPLILIMEITLLAMIVGSILFLAVNYQFGVRLVAIPLLVNIGTLLIVHTVAFDRMWENARFSSMAYGFEQVVEQIENNEIAPASDGYAILPESYRYLSSNGDLIRIERSGADVLTVLFFADYESANQFTGYIYRSDGSPPPSSMFNVDWRFLHQRSANWYFVVSYPQ
ncbi:MAG: hypothetical protein AAF490_05495 [Chloroflexota bacterium]